MSARKISRNGVLGLHPSTPALPAVSNHTLTQFPLLDVRCPLFKSADNFRFTSMSLNLKGVGQEAEEEGRPGEERCIIANSH